MWIWEQENWPDFHWDKKQIQLLLDQAHFVHQAFLTKLHTGAQRFNS